MECHHAAVIGTDSFKEQFIKDQVCIWLQDFILFSTYAQDDPHRQHVQHSPKGYAPAGFALI